MILILGDVHGHFNHVLPVVEEKKPKAIIFLGDLQSKQPLEKELAYVLGKTAVWFIHGNHDTDSLQDYDNLFGSALADRNLHGRVVEIGDIRVAGLGGVFRETIWYPKDSAEIEPVHFDYESYINAELEAERWKEYRRLKVAGKEPDGLPSPILRGKALTHRSSIFWNDWMTLYGQQADILVSHEAPSCHPNGFKAIDVLAQSLGVGYAFHGHHHDRLDYSAHDERLGFSAHGVGYCGITDQYGGVVRVGNFDEQRMGRYQSAR